MSRALPSVASSDLVKASFSLNILGADSLTTYQFSAQDIINISALSFEVPFGGGLGKPSSYTVTLGSSLDWIKTNRRNLVGADVRLSVHVNSDVFQPHHGRVRGIELDGADVNQVKLSIFDRFLDTNPLLPAALITDSFSTPHIEHLNDGQPAFYGNVGSRSIYFTAVTSNAGLFLGPTNIGSGLHRTDAAGISKQDIRFYEEAQPEFIFSVTSFGWQQQSAGSNLLLVGCEGLLLREVRDTAPVPAGPISPYPLVATTNLLSTSVNVSSVFLGSRYILMSDSSGAGGRDISMGMEFDPNVLNVLDIYASMAVPITAVTTVTYNNPASLFFVSSLNAPGTVIIDIRSSGVGTDFMTGRLGLSWSANPTAAIRFQYNFTALVNGKLYRRNSIGLFVGSVSAADRTAISTNPICILDHISSFQSGIPYRQDQSSAAQVLVQSWQFNGYVGPERVRLGTLLDDFASTVGFYAWAGDSGMVQYRVYQESGAATVDRTVGPKDFLEAPTFKTNPLGITLYNSALANKFSLDWNFTFHTGQYGNTTVAGAPNVSFCVSATAAGIQKEIRDQSKWIIDPDTASYAVGHMVRINGQGQEYVDMRLPARFFTIEPADVLQVQHPSIVGSAALYQVVRTEPDYLNGNVRVTASKLLDLTNPAV